MAYKIQAASINVSRAVYALNWFNIAPGLKYISADLKLQIIQLGIVTTGFYIGLASFQMVGGLLASRIGNRNTSVLGLTILGIGVLATGFSYNLPELFISRFLAGMGSALFFSPALGLLADLVPQGSYSFYVGLFNGSFNLGGGVGVIGWNFLDQYIGWRISFFIAGGIMLCLALQNLYVLRKVHTDTSNRTNLFSRARDVIRRREIWLLPIVSLAGILSETIIGQLFVYYAEVSLHMSPELASSIGTVYLLIGFVGGTLGGYLFGIIRKRYTWYVLSSALLAVLTAVIPFSSNYFVLLLIMVILGILTVNSFSMLYTLVLDKTQDRRMLSFSLSFVNFLQLAIGSFTPALFSVVAFYTSYSSSWIAMGIIGLACAALGITLMNEMRREFGSSLTKI